MRKRRDTIIHLITQGQDISGSIYTYLICNTNTKKTRPGFMEPRIITTSETKVHGTDKGRYHMCMGVIQ